MTANIQENSPPGNPSKTLLEQSIQGSRRASNLIIASAVTIGGSGFLLAAISSFQGKDLLPLGNPSTLIFVPQGLLMGVYGLAAALLATYLWTLIAVNFGSGVNSFNKASGYITIARRGFFKEIKVDIPLKDVKAVKLDVKEGINPRRRLSLRIQGRKDVPISKVGNPPPLIQLEKEGAQLARFLEIALEGL